MNSVMECAIGHTLSGMATEESKRGPGRPKGKKPVYSLHAGIDPKIGAALSRYMSSLEEGAKLKTVVENAMKLYLLRKGFWPDEPKRK